MEHQKCRPVSCTPKKALIVEQPTYVLKHPIIKNYDLRCSRGCVRNWTRFGQRPPIYQICDCIVNN